MLVRLIEAIQQGNAVSVSDLAARLEVSSQMVMDMLEFLESVGYVHRINASAQSCKLCTNGNECSWSCTLRLWQLKKGLTGR